MAARFRLPTGSRFTAAPCQPAGVRVPEDSSGLPQEIVPVVARSSLLDHNEIAPRGAGTQLTHCGDMHVQLSEPTLADDLLRFLRKLQCVAVADAAGTISVSIPDLVPEDARLELGLYLGVWRVMHPDVEVRLLP